MFAQYASDSRIAQLFRFYHFAEEAFHQQLVKHPYSDEIYFAKEVVELDHSRDRGFLPPIYRLRAIDADPETQVPVILAYDDFLIVTLGYQVPESAALQAERLYDGIPQFEKPVYRFGKIAEHFLEDMVR